MVFLTSPLLDMDTTLYFYLFHVFCLNVGTAKFEPEWPANQILPLFGTFSLNLCLGLEA